MALNFERLDNLRQCAGGHRAACPACRENGADKKGDHLFIAEDGRFGCAAFQGDHEHRSRIFQLVGICDEEESSKTVIRRRATGKRGRRNSTVRSESLGDLAAKKLGSILMRHRSDRWRKEFEERSPIPLKGSPTSDWSLLLGTLFEPGSILFVGEPTDSGPAKGYGHFRPVEEWLRFPELPSSRVAAATFEEGTVNRSKSRVASQPFLVLESDNLIGRKPESLLEREANKVATAALFRWLTEELGMHLVAVIDTGNKSLHGWFSYPRSPKFVEQLNQVARGLRLDTTLLNQPNAPVRLPGAIHERTGMPAQLFYLAPPLQFTQSGKP